MWLLYLLYLFYDKRMTNA